MFDLIIDTSTERGIVAFAKENVIVYSLELPFGLNGSKYLIPAIESGLQSLGIAVSDLSLIAAGVGPGSYTGIRVGAAVAQGLAYPGSIPLVGVCSLFGYAPHEEGLFASIIDARQGGVYMVLGEKVNGLIHFLSEPKALTLTEAESKCRNVKWLVGPALASLSQSLRKNDSLSSQWVERYPEPLQMLYHAKEKYAKGCFSSNGTLELLYLKEWRS